jgi:hypothetical protein
LTTSAGVVTTALDVISTAMLRAAAPGVLRVIRLLAWSQPHDLG